jgi:hypothetical protein
MIRSVATHSPAHALLNPKHKNLHLRKFLHLHQLSAQGAGAGVPQVQEFAGTFLWVVRVVGMFLIPR